MRRLARPRTAIVALSILAVLGGSALAGMALAEPAVAVSATPTTVGGVGARLFIAKGCVTCHRHDAVAGDHVNPNAYPFSGIPDLTSYRNEAAFLRRWLADAQAVRPATAMPNLDLTPDEIEALMAFLGQPPDLQSVNDR